MWNVDTRPTSALDFFTKINDIIWLFQKNSFFLAKLGSFEFSLLGFQTEHNMVVLQQQTIMFFLRKLLNIDKKSTKTLKIFNCTIFFRIVFIF
jgi:hypothetical protein